jgi:hypothetical protein
MRLDFVPNTVKEETWEREKRKDKSKQRGMGK